MQARTHTSLEKAMNDSLHLIHHTSVRCWNRKTTDKYVNCGK